jgi:hypothetical protein
MKNRNGKTFEEVFEGYSKEFIELYKLRQKEAGNEGKLLKNGKVSDRQNGGFDWIDTKEGVYWANAISTRNFIALNILTKKNL